MLIVEKRNSEKYKMKEEYKNQVYAYFSTFLFSLFPICAYIRIWNNNSI